MRQLRRITAMAMLAAMAWPAAATAEDAFIRIEAKRGAAADAALETWRERFDDVVTFPLPRGFTGIGLGPMTPAEAAARMAQLKAAGTIPADSYLTGPGGDEPLAGLAQALAAAEAQGATRGGGAGAEDAAGAADRGEDAAEGPDAAAAATRESEVPRDGAGATAAAPAQGTAGTAMRDAAAAAGPAAASGLRAAAPDASPSTPGASGDEAGAAATATAPAAPDTSPRHIQLQATPGRISAEEALETWRRSFPEAQLWRIPGGWYAVALPAQPANRAQERLAALKAARRVPGDAYLATPGELGRLVQPQPGTTEAGGAPAPDTAVPSPGTGAAAATAGAGASPDTAPSPGSTAGDVPEASPPAPAVMPPVAEVQRALRWAGLYDGALDGQSGPGTRAAIEARVEATGGTASQAEAMAALIAERAAWRREMGLEPLTDAATGLTLLAPAAKLVFDRTERALSIYGPKDGSGAALILFAQPGGQQELEDLAGLVTALGWVPHPERDMGRGRFTLKGSNDLHIGHAEGRVADGMAEGWVLIWPAKDAENARRLAVEAGESFGRKAPAPGVDEAAARP